MGRKKKFKLISFDVDKTLTIVPVAEFLLRKYGKEKESNYLISLYRAGKISYKSLCIEINRLFLGYELEKIYKDMPTVPMRKNIERVVPLLKSDGLKVIILSDVPTCVSRYFSRYGFEDFLGPYVGIENGKVTDRVNYEGDKLSWLTAYLAEHGISLKECIHVGDSKRDKAVFEKVGLGVALNPSGEEVAAAAKIALNTDNLLELYEKLEIYMHGKARAFFRKLGRRLRW